MQTVGNRGSRVLFLQKLNALINPLDLDKYIVLLLKYVLELHIIHRMQIMLMVYFLSFWHKISLNSQAVASTPIIIVWYAHTSLQGSYSRYVHDNLCYIFCNLIILLQIGDATVGKSALTQTFHSDGTHFPKNYIMVNILHLI